MTTNFRVKTDKIGLFTFICSPNILKQIENRHSIFKSLFVMIWLHRVKIWWYSSN